VQRSGGTLLSQLFDAHPEVLAFPSELHFVKKRWPHHVKSVSRLLARHDEIFGRFVEDGYQKFSIIDDGERHPFEYDIRLRDELIEALLRERPNPSRREVFDAFFTAFFAAWKRRTSSRDPRYVSAFAARANIHLARTTPPGLFADYPDGALITLVRRPLPWFASARRHARAYSSFVDAMALWTQSAESGLHLYERFPDRVTLLTFESLVGNTQATMRALCAKLDLEFTEILCVPTFDGVPIKSDSNFLPSYGIDESVLTRDDFAPQTAEERETLLVAEALYERVAELTTQRTITGGAPPT
jgi:hypothetical protein